VATPTSANPGELVVYSGRSEALVRPIIEQFQRATGVKVTVKYGGTAQIAATILEEGRNSPADVFFAQDPGGLGAVAPLFASLPETLLNGVPAWARSPNGVWVGISGRARVLAYNTSKLTEAQLPDDIRDLTKPEWRGRIGWAPSNGSFQAMVTAMRVLWGEGETRTWLEGMKANQPRLFTDNASQVAAVAAGEIDVALVNHYYLYGFLASQGDSFKARNYYPRSGGPESLMMVAGAGVLNTAKNKENALRFVEFMLSPVAQQYFASQTYEYPLVAGVRTDSRLKPADQIKKPDVDMAKLQDLAGTQKLLRDLGIIS
jgi:iron(III) transport system substrate-binding protein